MMNEGRGVRVEGERLSVKEEGSGGELGSDLDLDPDPWKILWIRIRQNDADPLDPDPQHCFKFKMYVNSSNIRKMSQCW